MVIEFLKSYWREILEILAVLASIIICCIKKKPVKVVDTIKQMICTWLPGVISAAESSGLKGEAKLEYAINFLYSVFAKDYLTRDEFDNKYLAFVKAEIEAILSTPQKKGVL